MKTMKNLKFIYKTLLFLIAVACTDQSIFNNPAIHELENRSFIRFESLPPTSFDSVEGFAITGTPQNVNNNTSSYSLHLTATITKTTDSDGNKSYEIAAY
jgi:hypothetical protein